MRKRRYKVRVRGKVRNNLLRRGGIAAGAALGLAFSAWGLAAAARHSGRLLEARLFSFTPRAFSISCSSPQVYSGIKALADADLGKPFTSGAAADMAGEIKRLHPGLSSVRVFRNFLTGKVSVDARPEEVLSSVLSDGTTVYLGTSGRLMTESLSSGGEAPFAVELRNAPSSAPSLAAFVAQMRPMAGLFYSRPVSLFCDGRSWDCSFRLADGTEVLWGGFEFNRLKIIRLNEVMKDALSKTAGPLRADLRGFGEGKIFVSALKKDGNS